MLITEMLQPTDTLLDERTSYNIMPASPSVSWSDTQNDKQSVTEVLSFEGSHYNFLRREQYTVVNKCRSQTQQINCGLPQGSILSPLLFSLYVNDLPKVSHFKTTLFADDTYLILSNKNIDILEQMADQEIKKVDSWMRHNKLSLNCSKTVYMIFNSDKKQSSPFRVQIGSNLINRVHSTKYLGMHLDHKLSWDTHISKLESKLSCYSGNFTEFEST